MQWLNLSAYNATLLHRVQNLNFLNLGKKIVGVQGGAVSAEEG